MSFSKDGGKNWSKVAPMFMFTTPDSPMQILKCGEVVVAVFNPVPFTVVNQLTEQWNSAKRTPLAIAVSENDGREFSKNEMSANGKLKEFSLNNVFLIEDDPSDSYCYPAIFDGGDYILVGYYHSNGTGWCLNCGKIVKICKTEFKKHC